MGKYPEISIPATFLLCVFELKAVVTVWCNGFDYSVFVIMISFSLIAYSISLGFCIITNIIVRKNMAQKKIITVKKTKQVSIIFGAVQMLINGALIIIFKWNIFELYIAIEKLLQWASLVLLY